MHSSLSPVVGLVADAAPSFLSGPLPMLILMFVVMYLLVLRPASKAEKERRARLGNLQRGDEVRLNGGILGKISSIDGDIAMVEIADRVKIRVVKSEISDLANQRGKDAAKDAAKDAPGEAPKAG
ncbi:MAG: preprotein translocase subunit YajC [Nannocystaceae bacterium]